jgi:hypothetical protein
MRNRGANKKAGFTPAFLMKTNAANLSAVFIELEGVCHGQRHNLCGWEDTQPSAQTTGLRELGTFIGAAILPVHHRGHGMPAVPFQHGRRRMVAGNDKNVGF